MITDKPLTPPQIAERLRVKPDTVRAWIAAGELRAFSVGTKDNGRKRWRIRPEDLEAFIVTRQNRPAPPKPARHSPIPRVYY